jgi:pimeloyl-ACP methyl ester carboxylesterase
MMLRRSPVDRQSNHHEALRVRWRACDALHEADDDVDTRNAEQTGFGNDPKSYKPEIKPMKTAALFLTVLLSAAVKAQKPATGYAPVNGLRMYYEIQGKGEPVVLLHGAFMTITNNWPDMIAGLSKTRQVIAVEMQGHGRTADIERDFSYANLADDIAAMLDYLKIDRADVIGYSLGGGVAMQLAIRHPDKVRKVVSISAVFRQDGLVKEALDAFAHMSPDDFKGSPLEAEYKKLSPTPDAFPSLVKRVIATGLKPYDFGAEKLGATRAPMFFIHGDADGARLAHVAEMFGLKGGEIHGDLRARSESRLAILPNTTHVTLMQKIDVIVPMINDFLDATPTAKKPGA